MGPGVNEPQKIVYWHRELPPLDADIMAEHSVEASSGRVSGTIAHLDEHVDSKHNDVTNDS